MVFRSVIILLLICTACNSGLIPCPKVKADKVKRTTINKRLRYAERNSASASVAENKPNDVSKRTNSLRFSRSETRPALEHVNVEEWDCPKPGMKRNLP